MKINSELREVLQNFASINPSIVFKPGNTVSTISPMKTVVAKATSPVSFDSMFGIYNLGQFLATHSAFQDPELTILDNHMIFSEGNETLSFSFAEPTLIITPPEKEIKFPRADVEFDFKDEILKRALKIANIIQSPELAVTGDGEYIYIECLNTKNSSDNKFKVEIGETPSTFKMVFLIENLVLLPRDYHVEISAAGLSHFKADDVEYWITVQSASSSFGE